MPCLVKSPAAKCSEHHDGSSVPVEVIPVIGPRRSCSLDLSVGIQSSITQPGACTIRCLRWRPKTQCGLSFWLHPQHEVFSCLMIKPSPGLHRSGIEATRGIQCQCGPLRSGPLFERTIPGSFHLRKQRSSAKEVVDTSFSSTSLPSRGRAADVLVLGT